MQIFNAERSNACAHESPRMAEFNKILNLPTPHQKQIRWLTFVYNFKSNYNETEKEDAEFKYIFKYMYYIN